jgi:RecA/RadA recombinase
MQRFPNLFPGGGIGLGSVTELAGQPGVGKTQACIQWCVTVQWPKELGGLRGRAVYLDCDANFYAERVHQVLFSNYFIFGLLVYYLSDFTLIMTQIFTQKEFIRVFL